MPSAVGHELHDRVVELFPITRSITGPGFRTTLDILERDCGPMERHRFPTGQQVLDWVVPPEWSIREAWIKDPSGRTVLTLEDSNLHVVNYSVPVHRRLGLAELQEHLHSLPAQPDAIPYRTLPGTDHPAAAYFTRGVYQPRTVRLVSLQRFSLPRRLMLWRPILLSCAATRAWGATGTHATRQSCPTSLSFPNSST